MDKKQMAELIRKDERNYELTLQRAADEICSDNNIKLVLITGGSCSGKTTTTKKLAELITETGRHTHTISLDDFYRNLEESVYLEDGTRDIETINSIEVGLIKQCFRNLVEGKKANIPRFDFISQRRIDNFEQIILDDTEVAIIEGLHALNPLLYEGFSVSSNTYRIYLYADDGNNGDPRFIRRLVRDWNYRGSDATGTYDQWDIVKAHEPEYIDQFANSADLRINTYFSYERGLFSIPATEILSQLPKDSIHAEEAQVLIKDLSVIEPIPVNLVPKNSLMQEFIKGT